MKGICALWPLLLAFGAGAVSAQTYVQLWDLDPPNTVGPRLTSIVVRNKLDRELFAELSSKITLIDAVAQPPIAYEFSSDGVWNRVLFGQKDVYINEFFNVGAGLLPVASPYGLDISGSRTLYIADRQNNRVLAARFDASTRSLRQHATASDPALLGVVDVAWDGGSTPLTDEHFYTVSGSGWVAYWVLSGGSAALLWTYGQEGTSAGQFRWPSGICVGRAAGANGGSVHTTDLYVADAGNRRLAWLRRGASGASWMSAVQLPDYGVPTDCTVDHFGNVTVVDSLNSRLVKYTWNLNYLDRYGTYGVGALNHNTFANPHAVHAPFGAKRNGSGQTIWYGEGRVITAERWGPESGAREHYLGIDASFTSAPNAPPKTGNASISYTTTEVAYTTVDVHQVGVGTIRTLTSNQLRAAGGGWGVYWDGTKSDGTRADDATYSFRVILSSAYQGNPHGPMIHSPEFFFDNCDPSVPLPTAPVQGPQSLAPEPAPSNYEPCTGNEPPPPPEEGCSRPPCPGPPAEAEPTVLFFRQHLTTTARPLSRVTGWSAPLAAPSAPAQPGALSALVREFGVRGLMFSVTRELSANPVMIRVHSMSGRPVRTLVNETLAPGVYEIGWDGLDDRGNRAAPGVYMAVLTGRSHRAIQRLILRQP